ncbi:MAG TPA: hypothetical protein DCQ15_09280 [Chitinophagaceae bacterium]|nr:hypothetical protein [Chitinophagaceae bacterium]
MAILMPWQLAGELSDVFRVTFDWAIEVPQNANEMEKSANIFLSIEFVLVKIKPGFNIKRKAG